MTAEASYTALFGLIAAATSATVTLVSEPVPEEPVIQRLSLTQELATEFVWIAQDALSSPDDVILKPYEAGYKPDSNELLYLRLADEPEIQELIRDIADSQNVELFAEDDRVIANLRFYASVFGEARGRAVFLRACSKSIELSHGLRVAALLRRGSYGKLTEKVFLFDKHVDCFAFRGYLFIRNVYNFQKMFDYYEQLRMNAAATVDRVAQYVPISNLDEFRTACTSQIQFMGKLAAIARKPYLTRVRMDDIKRVIDEFELAVNIVNDDGIEKVQFESSPQKRWLILKLLDDDYLGSVMTNQKYEVNSKLIVQ